MPIPTGPIGSSPVTTGPITAPSAPFGVPIAVTNQTASWSAAADVAAILRASGILVYREIETTLAAVDPNLGMGISSQQLSELIDLSSQVLALLRLRGALLNGQLHLVG